MIDVVEPVLLDLIRYSESEGSGFTTMLTHFSQEKSGDLHV